GEGGGVFGGKRASHVEWTARRFGVLPPQSRQAGGASLAGLLQRAGHADPAKILWPSENLRCAAATGDEVRLAAPRGRVQAGSSGRGTLRGGGPQRRTRKPPLPDRANLLLRGKPAGRL